MTNDTLLHRQVHPSFVIDETISSQAFSVNIASSVFKPKKSDEGHLSVYNGDKFSAEQSYHHFTESLESSGVVSVTVQECNSASLNSVADNDPFEGHAYIDFTGLSTSQVDKNAKKLKHFATVRGWQYKP